MNENRIVLLVDDDKEILHANRRALGREGFRVICAETLAGARAQLAACQPAILVLDITLPDGSGLDFCREIRNTTFAPILFLTARDEESEIVEGLRAGACDYITKPYNVDEFTARVKAHYDLAQMNRKSAEQIDILSRGPLELDVIGHHAFQNGRDMDLSPMEFTLLYLFVQNEGQYLTPRELYEQVWSRPPRSEGAAKNLVSRLRRKISGSGYSIRSHRGKGYVFGKNTG